MEACELKNIEFVSGLNNLEVVNLQGNEIRDYTALENCKKLRKIYTYGNPRLEPDLPERVVIETMPERDTKLILK